MKKLLEYKGYFGTVEYSEADKVMFGEVLGIRSLLSYEGGNVEELEDDFRAAVEDYFEMCEIHNFPPEKSSFSPQNVQLSPNLQTEVEVYSQSKGKTMQEVVEKAVEYYMELLKKSPETT